MCSYLVAQPCLTPRSCYSLYKQPPSHTHIFLYIRLSAKASIIFPTDANTPAPLQHHSKSLQHPPIHSNTFQAAPTPLQHHLTPSNTVPSHSGLSMFQIKVSNKYTGDDFNEDLHTILCWVGCKSIAVLDVAMVLHFYRQLFSIFLKIFQNVLKCFPNILKCSKTF